MAILRDFICTRALIIFFLACSFLLPVLYADDYRVHQVQAGETVWRISREYGITVPDLLKLNNINDVTKVKSGTSLKVPIINNGNKDISIPDNNEINDPCRDDSVYGSHVLKKGETLWSVSRKYKVSVADIMDLNDIRDQSKIRCDMKLKIPVKADYADYLLPAEGDVKCFRTSHFTGIHIFTDTDEKKREVASIDDGVVSYVDNVPGYGLTIFIKHNDDCISTYSGFEKIIIRKDDAVKKGQVIGYTGNLSRFNKYGILFSIQINGKGLDYDIKKQKFIKKLI